jgi:D-glycero-alpha-D-manno-heptose-7-phosphate kinase
MIVTRTPFRVTLGGGGTDLPSYYERHGGFVFAMAITHYMYVMVNPRFIDRQIVLHYRQSEVVDSLNDLRHDLVREALRTVGVHDAIEIASIADLPAGSGVGSSGSFLVGLLLGLHHLTRDHISLQALAEEACAIELDVLRKPIGKQDQFIATFGGLTALHIDPDGTVRPEPIALSESARADLVANSHIYYTGRHRDAVQALEPQHRAALHADDPRHTMVVDSLKGIKEIGLQILDAIRREHFDEWGRLLHDHWVLKKQLSPAASPDGIDEIYDEARDRYGVLGGKIIGAGGGGFLMLYCPTQHRALEQFMASHGMPRLHYAIEPEGARVMADMAQARRPAMARI